MEIGEDENRESLTKTNHQIDDFVTPKNPNEAIETFCRKKRTKNKTIKENKIIKEN